MNTALAALAFLASCDEPAAPLSQDKRQSPPPAVAADYLKQRQADFLNRIRDADPEHRTIRDQTRPLADPSVHDENIAVAIVSKMDTLTHRGPNYLSLIA